MIAKSSHWRIATRLVASAWLLAGMTMTSALSWDGEHDREDVVGHIAEALVFEELCPPWIVDTEEVARLMVEFELPDWNEDPELRLVFDEKVENVAYASASLERETVCLAPGIFFGPEGIHLPNLMREK